MARATRVPKAILEARGSALAAGRVDAPTLAGTPEPTAWMDEDARPYWDWIVANAHPDVLAKCDAGHIQMVAESWLLYVKAQEDIRENGLTYMAHTGSQAPNPAILIRKAAWAQVVSGLAKLGMNPSDRSNVAVATPADKGKVGRFIAVA